MSETKLVRLDGKDWFREPEAAEYCGVALSTFREGIRTLGVAAKRVFGRKLYSRAALNAAIAASPEWQPSTPAADPGISVGPKAVSTSGDPSARLRPQRLRKYAPRKRQS